MRTQLEIGLIFGIFAIPAARADVVVSHSGYLLDGQDAPVSGSVTLDLGVYDDATAGTAVWTATCPTTVRAGYYDLRLGSGCGSPFTTSQLPATQSRWLQVKVGSTTLTPRLLLSVLPASADSLALGGVAASGYWKKTDAVDATTLGGLAKGDFWQKTDAVVRPGDDNVLTGHNTFAEDIVASKSIKAASVQVAQGGTCDPAHAGTLQWSGTHFEGCDGTGWRLLDITTPPQITSVSPGFGGTRGGRSVTLVGTGFVSGTQVYFGGVAATNVVVVSGVSITATTPAATLAGVVDVAIDGPGGSAVKSSAFTYNASGETSALAGTSCKTILDGGGSIGSAKYWVKPGSTAFEARCDMSTLGGGWTAIYSSQVVHVWSDYVTSDTTYLDTLTPAGSRTSVYSWPLTVSDLALECVNRNTSARHFYTSAWAASTFWPALKSCTAWNCGRTHNGDSGTATVQDYGSGTAVAISAPATWRWNLGGEGQTNAYDDFSLDANWSVFTPNENADPRVAWGTGDGGNLGQGRNRCAGADLSTAGSQPAYTGSQPSNPGAATSNGYFYIWVR